MRKKHKRAIAVPVIIKCGARLTGLIAAGYAQVSTGI